MKDELKRKVEAVIFAIGKSAELESISKLVGEKDFSKVRNALKELREEYENRNTSLIIIEEGTRWKLTVKDFFIPLVKNIVADTELSKSLMETLAVIAWKQPIKQSEVINIRTNKAYDHIKELEEMGFITKQPFQRTRLIKLTDKFFKYFELEGERSIRELLMPEKPKGQEKLTTLQIYGEGEKKEAKEKIGDLEVFEEKDRQSEETEDTKKEEKKEKDVNEEERTTGKNEDRRFIEKKEIKEEKREDNKQENISESEENISGKEEKNMDYPKKMQDDGIESKEIVEEDSGKYSGEKEEGGQESEQQEDEKKESFEDVGVGEKVPETYDDPEDMKSTNRNQENSQPDKETFDEDLEHSVLEPPKEE